MKSLDLCGSIPEAFFEIARAEPDMVVYHQAVIDPANDSPQSPRVRRSTTFREVRKRVQALAQFFRNAGVGRGDKVAIISQSRPEWLEADLAVLAAGGVVVAVYPSLVSSEVGYLLFDSGARVVVVENQEQVDKLVHLLDHECPIPATEERASLSARVTIERILCMEEAQLPEAHHYISAGVPRLVSWSEALTTAFEEQRELHEVVTRDELASLVYTSGTTGAAKGVMQTHGNHLANVRQARDTKLFTDSSRIVVFLPLAHAFAKLMGYIGVLTQAQLEFPAIANRKNSKADPDSITRDIREGQADVVPAVPRILEKMQDGILRKAERGGLVGMILKLTLWAAREKYAATKAGAAPSLLVASVFACTRGVRRKVKRQLFGSRFRFAVSGGAKLQVATNEFFDALEMVVLEGYGLTETVVATNINRLDRRKIGTVGPPLASDILIKIADDGEILFKGPNIAVGYFNRPVATKQAWDEEGWFHTGDLGSLDGDGLLCIQGRKKELIVTSGGKKIPPDPIEQKLKLNRFVSQVMIFGDEKPFCIALMTLNMNAAAIWAAHHGLPESPLLAEQEEIRKEVWQHVEKVNASLASFESIKRIRLLGEEFTIDNGLLTPTLKVRRREVVKRYRDLIEEIYASDREW